MIKLFFSVLILLTSNSFATTLKHTDATALNIIAKEKEVEIEIPKGAYTALNKWNSQFTVFDRSDFSPSILELFDDSKTQPMAFIGDFEGNGKNGIVLFGQDTKTQYVVALIPNDKTWRVVEISSTKIANIKKSEVPTLQETKEIGIPYYVLPAEGEHAVKLKKKTGIQVETFLGPAAVYEIKKDKPVQFILE